MTSESARAFIEIARRAVGKYGSPQSIDERIAEGEKLFKQVCEEVSAIYQNQAQDNTSFTFPSGRIYRQTPQQETPTTIYDLVGSALQYKTLPETCRILGRKVETKTYVQQLLAEMDDNGNFRKRKMLDAKDVETARKVLSSLL